MKIEMKKLALIISLGILSISGLFGVTENDKFMINTIEVINNYTNDIQIRLNPRNNDAKDFIAKKGVSTTETVPGGMIYGIALKTDPDHIVDLELGAAATNRHKGAITQLIKQAVTDFKIEPSSVELKDDKLVITFGKS